MPAALAAVRIMCAKAANPGCKCCLQACGIVSDAFDYTGAPSSSLWTVVSGTWSGAALGSPTDAMQGSTDGVLITQAAALNSKTYATVVVKGASGDQGRLIVNYADASNYHYLQVTIGATGCLELHRVQGGTDTLLQRASFTPGTVSNPLTLALYFISGYSFGTYVYGSCSYGDSSGVNQKLWLDYSDEPEFGLLAGIGTGGTASSSLYFYNFAFAHANQSTSGGTACSSISPACASYTATLVGCEWDQVSGTFTTSGTSAVPSGSGATMLLQRVNAFPYGACSVAVNLTLAPGDVAQIIFAWQDSNNYCYVQYSYEGPVLCGGVSVYWGHVEAWQVAAGVPTMLYQGNGPPTLLYLINGGPGSFTGAAVTINELIHFNNGLLAIEADGDGFVPYGLSGGNVTVPLADPGVPCLVGIGCPATPSASWALNSFTWTADQSGSGDVPSCNYLHPNTANPCSSCTGGEEPQTLQVTFSGVAMGTGASPCPNWNDFNTTTFEFQHMNPCEWQLDWSGCFGPCGILFRLLSTGLDILSGPPSVQSWQGSWPTLTPPTDCASFSFGGLVSEPGAFYVSEVYYTALHEYIDFRSATVTVTVP